MNNDEIRLVIKNIHNSIGIKESMPNRAKLLSLISNGKTKKAIKLIAEQFGLPIEINLIIVKNDFFNSTALNNKFHENGYLSDCNKYGIVAKVTIPNNLPFFGSPTLVNFPIDVYISRESKRNKHVFAMIMAHEISHVFLHSLNHPLKEDEVFTDITALTQGFLDIYQFGRKKISEENKYSWFTSTSTITKTTTTYGYLDDRTFEFAFKEIFLILKKSKEIRTELLKQTKNNLKIALKFRTKINHLKNKHQLLLKNVNVKFSDVDWQNIRLLFQPGYFENLNNILLHFQNKIIQSRTFVENVIEYKPDWAYEAVNYQNELIPHSLKIIDTSKKVTKEIKRLRKYIKYKEQLKSYLYPKFVIR